MSRTFQCGFTALLALSMLGLASAALADAVDDQQAKAAAAAKKGDFVTAGKAATQAVGLARKKRGKNHESVGPLAFEAGTYLMETRDYKRASAAFSISVKNAQQVHGKSSLKGAEPLRMLAVATLRNGDTEKARGFYDHYVRLMERATGAESLKTAEALLEAAEVDIRTRHYESARRRLRQAIRGFKRGGESQVPQVAGAQLALGMAYFLDKSEPNANLKNGGEFFKKAIKTYEDYYPLGSPEIIEVFEEVLAEVGSQPMAAKMASKLQERLVVHKAAAGARS